MRGLIQASLANPYAVIVGTLTVVILGALTLFNVPQDILPVFKSPAVQVLTFYGGMPAEAIEKNITVRMERWTGQSTGMRRQESRSVIGASIVRNLFQDDQNPNGALTQVNSLALATIPNLPPGTLPPVVLPYDPTSSTPIALVTVKTSGDAPPDEALLYDLARYKVRNYIMQNPGASLPVAIGGKIRAVILYLNQTKMQAHKLSPEDVMKAVRKYNLFFADGDVKVGKNDYALSSNSMFELVERMKQIPISTDPKRPLFLGEVATPTDASFIQTNVVRVDGKRQVYIPVYRQIGASTLDVVDTLRATLPDMQAKLGEKDIELQVAMDQSTYVRSSIRDLEREGLIGAVLCSLVILLFLGQWRMTFIAIVTLPISVLAAVIGLHYTGQTINVMTLAGLTLAIGPMIDSAIICLENTHRYLTMGVKPKLAALHGASEVAMPELVSTLCTFLVLSPLALMPGMGRFLFLPMTLAVMFAMASAYILSRTLVPCASAFLLHHHQQSMAPRGLLSRGFARWEALIDHGIARYVQALDVALRFRVTTIALGFGLLALMLVMLLPVMRREFFPEVDSRAFEIAARARSGTRIEKTEELIAQVESYIRTQIPKHDLNTIISEIGLTSDWAAAYTQNSGPMDAVVKIQLEEFHRGSRSSQEYIRACATISRSSWVTGWSSRSMPAAWSAARSTRANRRRSTSSSSAATSTGLRKLLPTSRQPSAASRGWLTRASWRSSIIPSGSLTSIGPRRMRWGWTRTMWSRTSTPPPTRASRSTRRTSGSTSRAPATSITSACSFPRSASTARPTCWISRSPVPSRSSRSRSATWRRLPRGRSPRRRTM